ncbi:MAG: hypothetical protein DELT_03306 [Desulfovibrio sp.]
MIRSHVIWINTPKEKMVQIEIYCVPISAICAPPSIPVVNASKNIREKKIPKAAKPIQLMMPRKIPAETPSLASSNFFSPRRRETREFMPTPVPTATAIMSICTGNASDTAAKAFSLYWPTNTLSTTLYSACTSMEIMMGSAIVTNNFLTGRTPILFSFTASIHILSQSNVSRSQIDILSYKGHNVNKPHARRAPCRADRFCQSATRRN